eukprot:COSAG01_NODE_452_length_16879_cov_474.367223_17_plen_71_part_00
MSRRIDVRTYDERVCARMLRVGERAMDGDRRVRILLLLDRAAALLAGRPAELTLPAACVIFCAALPASCS